MVFPDLDERTLMTIATAMLPDKFDSQLQEGVSMGMRHFNTMAHVIDKTLGFESSDDKDVQVVSSSKKPRVTVSDVQEKDQSSSGSQVSPPIHPTTSGDLYAKLDEKMNEKFQTFAEGQKEVFTSLMNGAFAHFLQCDEFTSAILKAMKQNK